MHLLRKLHPPRRSPAPPIHCPRCRNSRVPLHHPTLQPRCGQGLYASRPSSRASAKLSSHGYPEATTWGAQRISLRLAGGSSKPVSFPTGSVGGQGRGGLIWRRGASSSTWGRRTTWTDDRGRFRTTSRRGGSRARSGWEESRVRQTSSAPGDAQHPSSSSFQPPRNLYDQQTGPTNQNVLLDRLGMHFAEQADATPFALADADLQHSLPTRHLHSRICRHTTNICRVQVTLQIRTPPIQPLMIPGAFCKFSFSLSDFLYNPQCFSFNSTYALHSLPRLLLLLWILFVSVSIFA
jgi:hypothetical protein